MTTKHTKTPWIIEERANGFYICSEYKGFVIADVTGDEIAHFVGNVEEAEANAKLIAAAPDLLESLIIIYNEYKAITSIRDKEANRTLAIVEHALDKATT